MTCFWVSVACLIHRNFFNFKLLHNCLSLLLLLHDFFQLHSFSSLQWSLCLLSVIFWHPNNFFPSHFTVGITDISCLSSAILNLYVDEAPQLILRLCEEYRSVLPPGMCSLHVVLMSLWFPVWNVGICMSSLQDADENMCCLANRIFSHIVTWWDSCIFLKQMSILNVSSKETS